MARAHASPVALVAMLTVFLADSTVSAQGTYRYSSPGSTCRSYNGSCSRGRVPSYGSNVYSRGMTQVHQQIANRIALENWQKGVEAYFERKLANIDYRGKLKVARIHARFQTQREIANLKYEYADVIEMNRRRAEELAQRLAPKRLTESEYNPVTGAIHWPSLLRNDRRFAEARAQVDVLFVLRDRHDSGVGSENSLAVREATNQMKSTLKAMQGQLGGITYVALKNFLSSVAYEAYFASEPGLRAGVSPASSRTEPAPG